MKKILNYPYLLIAGIALLVYCQSLFFDFVYIDDNDIVQDQYSKISKVSNVGEAFTHDAFFTKEMTLYRPILTISIILNAQIGETYPFVYHLTNIILHCIVSCLIYWLFIVLKYKNNTALMIGLIFAVHPAFVNPVNWIVARDGIFAALFLILSLIFFIKYFQTKNKNFLIIHLVTFGLGAFSKEVSLVFPALLVVYYWLFVEKKLFSKRNFLLLLCWVAVIILFFYLRSFSMEPGLKTNIRFGLGPILTNLAFLSEAVFKSIFPFHHSVLPSYSHIQTIGGCFLIVLISIMIFIKKDADKKKILFGALWFLIFAIPGMAIKYPLSEIYFDYVDNRIYLMTIGLFIILIELLPKKDWNFANKTYLIITILILTIYSIFTIIQSKNYSGPSAFWDNAKQTNPGKAMIYYRSGYAIWKYNLSQAKEGNKLLQEQMNPVIDDLKRAIDLHPDPTYVLKNMLILQRSLKRWDDAYSYGIKVKDYIKKNPDKADYLLPGLSDLSKDVVDIGVGFYKLKQFDKGILMTNQAIELFPENSVAYTNLGIIYKAKGNIEEARKMWEKAIQIDPKDLDPYKHLLVSYMDVKDYKNALKWALLFNQNGGKLEQSLLEFLKKY